MVGLQFAQHHVEHAAVVQWEPRHQSGKEADNDAQENSQAKNQLDPFIAVDVSSLHHFITLYQITNIACHCRVFAAVRRDSHLHLQRRCKCRSLRSPE